VSYRPRNWSTRMRVRQETQEVLSVLAILAGIALVFLFLVFSGVVSLT
jgi:hypothetical protein